MILFTRTNCLACEELLSELTPQLLEETQLQVMELPAPDSIPGPGGVRAWAEADFYNVTTTPCLVVGVGVQVLEKGAILSLLRGEKANAEPKDGVPGQDEKGVDSNAGTG